MVIQGYLLSFEQWLKKMEAKNKKLTAFFIGVWVFGTVGFVIKSIYIYSDIGHKIGEWAIGLVK
jgi:hypothetical protein